MPPVWDGGRSTQNREGNGWSSILPFLELFNPPCTSIGMAQDWQGLMRWVTGSLWTSMGVPGGMQLRWPDGLYYSSSSGIEPDPVPFYGWRTRMWGPAGCVCVWVTLSIPFHFLSGSEVHADVLKRTTVLWRELQTFTSVLTLESSSPRWLVCSQGFCSTCCVSSSLRAGLEGSPTQGHRVLPQPSEFSLWWCGIFWPFHLCLLQGCPPPHGFNLEICSAGSRVDCLSGSHLEGGRCVLQWGLLDSWADSQLL